MEDISSGQAVSTEKDRSDILDILDDLIGKGAGVNDKDSKGRSALIIYSEKGQADHDIVAHLIKAGANVNDKNKNGDSALILSAENGHSYIVELLIDGGADIDYKGKYGLSALMVSSWTGEADIVERLIKAEAKVNEKNEAGNSALICSSLNGHSAVVESLIKAGANVNDKNDDGDSALICSSWNAHGDIVKLLIEANANVNDKNICGDSALIASSRIGRGDIIELLIKAGANVNDKNVQGYSALIVSAEIGRGDIVELLIKQRAAVNDKDNNGNSALIFSSKTGHSDIVELLIKEGAEVNDKNNDGESALIVACKYGHLDIVEILIKEGAEVNDKDNNGDSALIVSSTNGKFDIVELLIKEGAEVNIKNDNGDAALIVSSKNGHFDIVQHLIAKGAEVNDDNAIGESALTFSSRNGDIRIVNALLEVRGINVDHENQNAESAIMLASRYGHTEIVEKLIENNAHVDIRLFYAAKSGHVDVCKLLCDANPELLETIREYAKSNAQMLQIIATSSVDTRFTIDISSVTNIDTLRIARILAEKRLINLTNRHAEHGGRSLPFHDFVDYSILFNSKNNYFRTEINLTSLPDKVYSALPRVSELIRCPGVGSVHAMNVEVYSELPDMPHVFDVVDGPGIRKLCAQNIISEVKKSLAGSYYQCTSCGSAAEGTKVMAPDEFDFDFVIFEIRDFEGDTKITDFSDVYKGYKYLFRRHEEAGSWFIISSKEVHEKFVENLAECLHDPSIISEVGKVKHGGHANTEIKHTCPEIDKNVVISMDLVPVIHFKKQWPDYLIQRTWKMEKEELKSKGFYLVAKPPHKDSELGKAIRENEGEVKRTQLWSITFPHLETIHIAELDLRVKEAYIAAKCLRNPDVCRILIRDKDGNLNSVDKYVTSYMLKTVFLHNAEDFLASDKSLIQMVCIIFHDLEGCLAKGFLPLFWQHDVNTLTGLKTDSKKILRVARLMRQLVDGLYKKETAEERMVPVVEKDGSEEQKPFEWTYSSLLKDAFRTGYYEFSEE